MTIEAKIGQIHQKDDKPTDAWGNTYERRASLRRTANQTNTLRFSDVLHTQRVMFGEALTVIILSALSRDAEDTNLIINPDPIKFMEQQAISLPNWKTIDDISGKRKKLEMLTGCQTNEQLKEFFITSITQNIDICWDEPEDPNTQISPDTRRIITICAALKSGQKTQGYIMSEATDDQIVYRQVAPMTKSQVIATVNKFFGLSSPNGEFQIPNQPKAEFGLNSKESVKKLRHRAPMYGNIKLD